MKNEMTADQRATRRITMGRLAQAIERISQELEGISECEEALEIAQTMLAQLRSCFLRRS